MELINDFFQDLGILLIFINACLYLWSYRSSKPSVAHNYLSLYLALSFIIVLTTIILGKNAIPNLYLSHYYFLIQFILLSLFYRSLFHKHQKRWVNTILILVILILIVQYSFKPSLYFNFNVLEIFLTSFPLVVYSIIHLYNSLSKKREYMYVNAGILIYLTTSTLIFILGDYLSNRDGDLIRKIWFLNKVLYVGYLVLILIEWRNYNRRIRSKS